MTGPIGDLARACGGTRALAERVGVTPRTLQRWARGEAALSGPARVVVEALCRQYGLGYPM
jgi:transcriptional regulator with XRE-family HTH domain